MSLSAGSGHPAAFIFIRCCRFAAVIQVMICEKAEERSGQAQFVICDVQREYAENLMNIISEKLKEEYQFHLFWNLQQLKEFSEKMPISRLLIAEEYPVEKRKEILAENRYLLTGKRSQEKEREGEYDWFQEEVPVYRYQSAEIILQKVTGRMELKEKVVADTSVRGMIGVYSPIHRIGKTKFAIRTARQLGRSVPVLYLNLEGNSGDNYYFQNREGNDLGDLLYYMRQDNMNLGLKLVGMIRQKGGVDYIPAIRNEQDFRNVDREEWLRLFEAILEKSIYEILLLDLGDSINGLSPIVDARLKDGSRVNVVMKPVAVNGPILTIRTFPEEPLTMKKLIDCGSMTEEAAQFIRKLVIAKYNIFVSGGTGAGKTTFLNAMSDFIPKDERIITIEDNAEMQIRGVENLVKLEARGANPEGEGAVTIRDLIRSALRMRPDRIIVGEVRGDETVDMISSAMLNGHSGSMSTGHANNPTDMLHRLETMMLMGIDLPLAAVQRQIASALDIIIHLGRLRDKSRKVLQITEIEKYESGKIHTRTLYEFREEGMEHGKIKGRLMKVAELSNQEKLMAAGYKEA